VGRTTDAIGRKATVRDCLLGGLWAVDHGEHDPLWAEIQGLLGPGGAALRQSEDRGGARGGQRAEAGERVGDAARAVLHVDNDEVVAGEAGDLSECGGEAEEEEAVEGLAVVETGFEGFAGGDWGEIWGYGGGVLGFERG
jgi:hypothetical protein